MKGWVKFFNTQSTAGVLQGKGVASNISSPFKPQRVRVHVHMWTRLPSQELQAAVNSEAKNMPSVAFLKTALHVEASGHLGEQCGGILWFY